MKTHEAVAAALIDHGVDTVFGLVGDANLYIMESFRQRGGEFIPLANESGVLLAAAGYQSVTGRLGVASVTHGPGLANATTSLIEAVKHRVPSVLIAGDTPVADLENFQDIPQRALVAATGAGFVQVRSADTAAIDLGAAIRQAVVSRLPVVLNVPLEVQWQEVEYRGLATVTVHTDALGPDSDALEAAVGVLAQARRPLILAGRGAGDAHDAIVRLARRIGAPLATTAQQRNFFTDDDFDLGIFGTLASEVGLEVISEADTIVAFGASLNRHTTADGSLTNGKRVIHIDDDPTGLGRFLQPTAGIVGDSARVADAVVDLLDEAAIPPARFADESMRSRLRRAVEDRSARVAHRREVEWKRERTGTRPEGTVDLQLALDTIESAFPKDRNLVIDAGRFCISALATMTVRNPRAYVHTINFAAIGVGVPYAIGAALGEPSRPTLLLCGDGGFMLGGLTEFNTAVRQNADLVVVVINDSSFGAEHIQLHNKQLDTAISMFDWPDLAPVAASLGGKGVTVRSIDDLDAALADLPHRDRPVLIDVKVSAREITDGTA